MVMYDVTDGSGQEGQALMCVSIILPKQHWSSEHIMLSFAVCFLTGSWLLWGRMKFK